MFLSFKDASYKNRKRKQEKKRIDLILIEKYF